MIWRARQPDDPIIVSALSIADRQVSRLVRLIDDLLDIGRVTAGQLEIRRDVVALADVITRSLETTRSLMEDRNQHVMVELPGPSVEVNGDRDRLVQVFTNLLTNAAKYTPHNGHIAVTSSLDDSAVHVHVQDTGIGIQEDYLETVFELFTRVRNEQHLPVDGLGVGLSLSRHIVERHDGRIWVTSKGTMRGSCFTVQLPLRTNGVCTPAIVPAIIPKRRVLIVDDHQDSADTLQLLIEAIGHDAEAVHDGGSALRRAAEYAPDLILLDLGLPDIDGLEVARILRLRPGGDALRIVALTGWGQPADRERTRSAGFDMHFVKPLSRDALETLVATLAELPSHDAQAATPAA